MFYCFKGSFMSVSPVFTGTARKDAGAGVIGTICQKWHQQKQERLNLISSLNLQATWSPVCPLITNGWIYIRQTDLDTSHSPTCQEIQTMEAKTSAFIGKHQLVKLFRTQWITPGQQPIFAECNEGDKEKTLNPSKVRFKTLKDIYGRLVGPLRLSVKWWKCCIFQWSVFWRWKAEWCFYW